MSDAALYRAIMAARFTPRPVPQPRPVPVPTPPRPRWSTPVLVEVSDEDPIRRVLHSLPPRPIINTIQRITADVYGVTVADIVGPRRTSKVIPPRQVAMTVARLLTANSLGQIGRAFGDRDHTCVLYAAGKYGAPVLQHMADLGIRQNPARQSVRPNPSLPWTAEQEETLRQMRMAGSNWREIAAAVGHSDAAAETKAQRMGLTRRQ